MTKLTNEDLQAKANVLLALATVYEFIEEDAHDEVGKAMDKLVLQLARDVNGLTL